MKTLPELKKEIVADENLRKAYSEAIRAGKTAEFLKAQGCDATVEDLKEFLLKDMNGELPDDELDNVAGGGRCGTVDCLYCGQPVGKLFAKDGMHPECVNRIMFS